MPDWRSVEDLTRWGFAQAPVVMANEAHNGLARCVRTREIGVRIIAAAHTAGVRRLAMEALPAPSSSPPEPIRAIPPAETARGYLAQPDMRAMIATALDLGWTLWAYEARVDASKDPAELTSMAVTNWREREQAKNLCEIIAAAPRDPLLVWCGNGHALKSVAGEWVPMGHHFAATSGIQHFVIDQTVTVDFAGDGLEPGVQGLLDTLRDTLTAHGGTIGILSSQVPPPWNDWPDVDAIVIPTENTLT